jgi:RsiW-degrading membrane proteinase PrsW (M82 family)
VAIILELVATIVIYLLVLALGQNVGNVLTNITVTPTNPIQIIADILNISVTAAVVEEGVKPLAAVLIMRRLRTPAEAFIVGMAGGIGFNMFEATGYITGEQADWISQAIGRSTAGLLHGVGAGMAALGWYYLINGKGVPLRWARGFGGILYAMGQHALNNAAAVLLGLVPPIIGQLFATMIVPGIVPYAVGDLLFTGYDVLIFLVLVYVTGRLRQSNTVSPYVDRPAQPYPLPQQSPAVAAVGGVR